MPLDLDGTLLRAFAETARRGGVRRAADALGRTQPAVSQQLRRLEDLVGRPLLVRSPSGVSLTREGELFLPYAERILALGREALSHVCDAAKPRGYRVGVIEELATEAYLRAVLARADALEPKVAILFVVDSWRIASEGFERGDLDVVVSGPIPQIAPRRRGAVHLAWAHSPTFDVQQRPLPLALPAAPCPWRDVLLDVLGREGIVWRPAIEGGGLAAMWSAVRAGAALAAVIPATAPPDVSIIEASSAGLPDAPAIDIALHQQATPGLDEALDSIASALWDALLEDVLWP